MSFCWEHASHRTLEERELGIGTSLSSWVSELDTVILFIEEAKTHNS